MSFSCYAGIYMPETFARESKYGLTVMTTTDEGLLRYMRNVQKQVAMWLMKGLVQRLVVDSFWALLLAVC